MSTDTSRAEQLSRRATIGIITALPKELSAVKVMLQSPVEWWAQGSGAGRRYVLGEVSAAGAGTTHAVALAPTDVGTNSAAIRVTNLLRHIPSIRHVIMCGIAGGIPSPEDDIRLGDIVVSDRKGIVGYDFIRQTVDEVQELHSSPPPGAELLEAVGFLEAKRNELQRPWERFLDQAHHLEDASRPPDNQGSDGKPIEYTPNPKRRPGLPLIFYGPIASANRLLRDEGFRDALRRRHRTKAVEMESFGVADATWSIEGAGYLVVRGISDFCDMRKGDLWQGYAAVAAAAYVRALLESMPMISPANRDHIGLPSLAAQDQHPPPASPQASAPSGPVHFQASEQNHRPTPQAPSPSSSPASSATSSTQPPPRPAVVSPAPKPVQARQSPPRRSAAGRIMGVLLLTAVGVGLMAYQDLIPSSSSNARGVLRTVTDGLKPPSSPSTLRPIPPSATIHTSPEGISGMRRLHHVRALQDAENGKNLGIVPGGIFGYINTQSSESLSTARVFASPPGKALEVHKLENGSIMLIGFTRDIDAQSISQWRPTRLTLSPTASIQAKTAIAVPIDWVRTFYSRYQGDIMLELFSASPSQPQ